MSEQTAGHHAPDDPLPCQTIVFRAIRSKSWIDEVNHRATADAFRRRSRENGGDDDGLSVNLGSVEACRAVLKKCQGVVSLHVGRVRDIGLDVRSDPEDADHALIVGLPYPEDDPDTLETLAGALAEQSRLAWRP
jgi:hypothetical protein